MRRMAIFSTLAVAMTACDSSTDLAAPATETLTDPPSSMESGGLPAWCTTSLDFDNGFLPPDWSIEILRGGPGLIDDRLVAAPTDGTVIINSPGAIMAPVQSIRVEYDAEHLFSSSGVVSQFQLTTTGQTYSVAIFNATASEQPNELGLSSQRYDGIWPNDSNTDRQGRDFFPFPYGEYHFTLVFEDGQVNIVAQANFDPTTRFEVTHSMQDFELSDVTGAYFNLLGRTQNAIWADDLVVECVPTPPDVVVLSVDSDTYVRRVARNQNQGALDFLRVRRNGRNRALAMVDQTGLLASVGGGTLLSAALEFTISDNGNNWGPSGRTVDVHRLTQSWTEAGATWNCSVDDNLGNHRPDCPTAAWEMGLPNQPELHPWIQAATASAVITRFQTGVVTFDVTQDVEDFLSGAAPNAGWIVRKTNEAQPGRIEFSSSEGVAPPRVILTIQR